MSFDSATKRFGASSGVAALARGMLRRDPFSTFGRHGVSAIGIEFASLDHIVVVAISHPSHALAFYPAQVSTTLYRGFRGSVVERSRDIAATRQTGYVVDEGRSIAGVTIITAPVILRSRMSNGLVLLGVRTQLRRTGEVADRGMRVVG